MPLNDIGIVRRILEHTKWFIFPAILVLYTSTAILMLMGILRLYTIVTEVIDAYYKTGLVHFALVSAHIITIIDIYLLALVCYIFAIGIYKLFIGNVNTIQWLKIHSIDDLKLNISKMVILFLATLMVQKVASWENPQDVLYFGIVIAVICAVLIWYSMMLQRKPKEE